MDTINLNLKKDEPVYVCWIAEQKGNYRLGFRTDDGTLVEYKYYSNNVITEYPPRSTSDNAAWDQYESNSANSRGLLLEANEAPARVEVYTQIIPRSLSIGGVETVALDYDKRYEEFNFNAIADRTYIFRTSGAANRMNLTMTDFYTHAEVTPDRIYYQDNDCFMVYTFEKNDYYKLRVNPTSMNNSSDTFYVSAYYYKERGGFAFDSKEDFSTPILEVDYHEEIWLQFNVEESNRYGFGADYWTLMKLYRFDNGQLELLGVKTGGSSSMIWSELNEGDVVFAQTCYQYGHYSGSYEVNVTCNLPQQETQYWTIYDSQTESTSISVNQGYEYAVSLNFDSLSSTADYTFRIESSYDSENIETAMYQTSKDENGIETRELIAEGYNFTCEINPNNSYELRISNYGNSYWYGSIYAEKAYPYEEYELTLDNNAQKVTVKRWFRGTVLFYRVRCYNKVVTGVANEI